MQPPGGYKESPSEGPKGARVTKTSLKALWLINNRHDLDSCRDEKESQTGQVLEATKRPRPKRPSSFSIHIIQKYVCIYIYIYIYIVIRRPILAVERVGVFSGITILLYIISSYIIQVKYLNIQYSYRRYRAYVLATDAPSCLESLVGPVWVLGGSQVGPGWVPGGSQVGPGWVPVGPQG